MARRSDVWTLEIAQLRELIRVTREADQRALEIQATEYSRRLEELNHAHRNIMERNAEYLPRSEYAQGHIALQEALVSMQNAMEAQLTANARLLYIGLGIVMVLSIIGGVFVTLFLNHVSGKV